MLPFKKQKEASIAVTPDIIKRKSDNEEHESDDHMELLADELIQAIHKKDSKDLAIVIRAMFEMMEEEPHHEGPHIGE